MVRFGKNGTDATSGAIRLARAFTGRERILACGYHGWQDWYIGSTSRHKGVPEAVRSLTHSVPYNDLSEVKRILKKFPGQFAAMIMEPTNLIEPLPGYLDSLKNILHENGVLLIFDEIITGFRFSLGGAQQLYGVKPDLSCFGKSMGNGMPISAILGRADVMSEMENIFFSGTFGGETLSLAASLAVIEKMQREPVIETLWERGGFLAERVRDLIRENELEDIISVVGAPPWQLLTFKKSKIVDSAVVRSFFIQEMLLNGVLINDSHNISYAHSLEDITTILNTYGHVLPKIKEGCY